MNTLTIILVLLAVIAIMGGILYVLIKDLQTQKKENQNLNNRLESARINIEQLSAFVDKLLEIKTDEKSVSQKIKEAKKLIRENNYSVGQISEMLGYSSIHNFSRAFKKAVGMSPSAYGKTII